MLYDASLALGPLVKELADSNTEPRDRAAYALAYRLAMACDQTADARALAELSSRLFSMLDALFATPKSRASAKATPEVKPDATVSEFAKLRAAHRSRAAAPHDGTAASADS